MYTYLIVAFLIITLVFKYDIKNGRIRRSFWEKIVIAILILLVGLRNHVGSDSMVYEWNFETSATPFLIDFFKDSDVYYQPLWMFVMSFCKTVFGSFVAVQFFHGIVFNILAFRFIKKTTEKTFTALLFLYILLWFTNSFEVLRESITAGIFLNSLFLLKKKRYVLYVLCGFIAMGFHAFAFIMFVLAPLVMILNVYVLSVFSILVFIVLQLVDFSTIGYILLQIVASSDIAGDKVSMYLNETDSSVFSLLGLLRIILLDTLLPLCVIYFSYKKDNFFVKLVILWMLFHSLHYILPILYRMDNYLELVYIILLVNVLYDNRIEIKSFRPVLVLLSVFVLIMGYCDIYRPNTSFQTSKAPYDVRYFPYKSIFQDPDPVREAETYYE